MKAYYEIIQGSEDWYKIKWGKIGGTRSCGLFIKTDNLLEEILSEKCEDFELNENNYISFEMQNGLEKEPMGRIMLSEYTKIPFKECGWLQCEENELMGISPDGITEDETVACEIKCPGAKRHLQTIKANEIPLDNVDQCLHYFTVNPKLEKLYFCSFRPENKFKPLFVKELTRHSIINIGTKAKPVMKTISDLVACSKKEAADILSKVTEILKTLSF